MRWRVSNGAASALFPVGKKPGVKLLGRNKFQESGRSLIDVRCCFRYNHLLSRDSLDQQISTMMLSEKDTSSGLSALSILPGDVLATMVLLVEVSFLVAEYLLHRDVIRRELPLPIPAAIVHGDGRAVDAAFDAASPNPANIGLTVAPLHGDGTVDGDLLGKTGKCVGGDVVATNAERWSVP